MSAQESEGLLSPAIRRMRLKRVAAQVPPGSRVLDLACGMGFLADELPGDCRYVGVDRMSLPYRTDAKQGAADRRYLTKDLLDDRAFDDLARETGSHFDVITMVAFLEHITDPGGLVRRCAALLADGGVIVGTTPHPCGRLVHDTLARLWLCSREGADEHETFLSRAELETIGRSVGTMRLYRRFLFGLNQLFVFAGKADA
jgi:2-polyprenyl-3-methyl-5-hydroxy-6-metoxy-1,4-benzoquinol methylase